MKREGIEGFSNYAIDKNGSIKNLSTNKVNEYREVVKLKRDDGVWIACRVSVLINKAFGDEGGPWFYLKSNRKYEYNSEGVLRKVRTCKRLALLKHRNLYKIKEKGKVVYINRQGLIDSLI